MDRTGWFVLGAPWDCSGTGRGEARAPAALRAAGLDRLAGEDAGDAATVVEGTGRDPVTGIRALAATATAARTLTTALDAGLERHAGRRPLVVGGDCSILLGIFPALRRRYGAVGLWLLDGHPDHLDGRASDTGETADLELALLTGRGPDVLTGLAGPPPMLAVEHAALIGHRTEDLDPDSAAEVAGLPAALFRIDAPTVLADPDAAGDRAARWAAGRDVPMWLHLDVDVLDAGATAAVTYPQPGGPDWDGLERLMAPLGRSPHLLGASVADHRPDLDPTGADAARLLRLLERTLP